MNVIFDVIGIILILTITVRSQTFETGDNSTISGCSSHCTVDRDTTLTCWNRTRIFYEQMIVSQLRHYIAVQINIDQWHRRHDGDEYRSIWNIIRNESIASMSALLHTADLINEQTIDVIVNALIDQISSTSNRTISWMPHFNCPLPCEYRYVTWRLLFMASAVLNIALAVAVIPFICLVSRRDNVASDRLIK